MKSESGAILIGVAHFGADNARRVIVHMEKNGLREGDVVADEQTQNDIEEEIKKSISGEHERTLESLRKTLANYERVLAKPMNEQERESIERKYDYARENFESLEYNFTLLKYLIKKKARIVGFEGREIEKARQIKDEILREKEPKKVETI
ncbi:MAG TPA: hypothetical protein VJH23_04420 [archaeon]|nr:hypothetical protein [archaeon]